MLPELNAGVTVRNLFNHRYEVVQGYPMPGCNLLLTVEYSW
jgi:outer membrane cobalamin receptor